MRLLKQVLFSLVMMLFAVVALNALRLATAPAQGNPAGEGQASIRNGDVNCDGLLNITDPILVLNWLFGDGPEPCAIAQTDTCCTELREEVAALRATVGLLAARIPSPNDLVTLRGTLHFATAGTRTILDVPDGKRLVLTSLTLQQSGSLAKVVSVSEGIATEITMGGRPAVSSQMQSWTSGLALPLGADLAMRVADDPASDVEYFFSGYLSGE